MPKRARPILIDDGLPINSANTDFLYNETDGILYYYNRASNSWDSIGSGDSGSGDSGSGGSGSGGSTDLGNLLTIQSASATYLSLQSASATYLSLQSASTTYLSLQSASTTYLNKSSASATYLPISASASVFQAAVDYIVDLAPPALNTLNKLAAALNDDENFSATVANSIATKLSIASASATYATKVELDGAGLNPFFLSFL